MVALAHVGDELEEVAAVRVVAEDRGPLVAPSRQVLDAVQDLETRRPLHYVTLAGSRPSPRLVDALLHIRHRCNKRDLTPVADPCCKIIRYADTRLALWVAKRHQQHRRYGWQTLAASPDRMGLISLNGTIVAPRPNRPWRPGR